MVTHYSILALCAVKYCARQIVSHTLPATDMSSHDGTIVLVPTHSTCTLWQHPICCPIHTVLNNIVWSYPSLDSKTSSKIWYGYLGQQWPSYHSIYVPSELPHVPHPYEHGRINQPTTT